MDQNQNQNQDRGEGDKHPLMEAARKGNIESLYEQLRRDPSVLDKDDQQFRDNPLHVAAMHNNALIAAEIANLKASLARRLNQDGLSPLHIAAENGHVETVKKLLKVDKELCYIKGREMMLPLHYAAKSGDPHSEEVIEELLSACPRCITALTTRNETVLHIAVRSGNFKNYRALLKWIKKEHRDYNILSWKNQEGNTILHLATSERMPENLKIVELLLCKYGTEINTKNRSGETALDVLMKTRTESLCHETRTNGSQTQPIQEKGMVTVVTEIVEGDENETKVKNNMRKILLSAGAKSADDICCTLLEDKASNKKMASLNSGIKWLLKILNFLDFKVGKDTPNDVRNALLVIFVLIVTVTYTTGINPPGGLWQDNNDNHTAGTSVWFDKYPNAFQLIMAFNYAGFFMSVVLIFILTEGYPLRCPILLALLFMFFTQGFSIQILQDKRPLEDLIDRTTLIVLLTVALFLLVPTATWMAKCFSTRVRSIWDIEE